MIERRRCLAQPISLAQTGPAVGSSDEFMRQAESQRRAGRQVADAGQGRAVFAGRPVVLGGLAGPAAGSTAIP
jgi:hypothetical protein